MNGFQFHVSIPGCDFLNMSPGEHTSFKCFEMGSCNCTNNTVSMRVMDKCDELFYEFSNQQVENLRCEGKIIRFIFLPLSIHNNIITIFFYLRI